MPQVDIGQACPRVDELLKRASDGEDVMITKDDRPFARITTPSVTDGIRKRQFGSVKGEIWMSEDFDKPLDAFQG
jgi:antitoxin (DNA-binding transcriptional repressor) of toxin-antitoxin stability system